jgi:chorismate mutase
MTVKPTSKPIQTTDMKELGREIERIDAEIVRLLNLRARTVQEISLNGRSNGHGGFSLVKDINNIDTAVSFNEGPLPDSRIKSLFSEIVKVCGPFSSNGTSPSENCRTSITFSLRNRPGSLYHALAPFEKNGVNIIRVENRPSRRVNRGHAFFIDIEGHESEPDVREAIAQVRAVTEDFSVLGSYTLAGSSDENTEIKSNSPSIEINE